MAYQKAFNPDALPAHAEPEEAAQALSALAAKRKQSPPTRPSIQNPSQQNYRQSPPQHSHKPISPGLGHRPSPPSQQPVSPAAAGRHLLPSQQHAYRPHNNQNHSYNQAPPPPPPPQNQTSFSRVHSPPPADYGYGPRPDTDPRTPLTPSYHPSRTPAPPDPDSADLWPLFCAANTSNTGSLTISELGSALVNADFTPFDGQTIRSLMGMFSTSPTGRPEGPTISYPEFQNLWRFLAAWRELFERFDEDRSGKISLVEFQKALSAFGYRLSQPFVNLLYNTFNERGMRNVQDKRGSRSFQEGMSFDLFVQACTSLKKMTDVFKGYDDDRDGYVTLSFEEFLSEILRLRD